MAKKKSFVENLGMTLSQPFRVGLLGGAQELGYTIGDLMEAYQGKLDTSRPKNYWGLTEEESKKLYKDPLKTGVKSAAGVMSWAVPGGSALKGARGIGQAALRGAGAGALSGLSYSEEGRELQGTMGGMALGGALGGGLQAVGSMAGKTLKKAPKKVGDQELRSYGIKNNAYNKIKGGSERAKKGVAVLNSEADEIGVSLADRYAKDKAINPVIKNISSKVDRLAKNMKPVTKTKILKEMEDSVRTVPNFQADDAYTEVVNILNKYGDELTGPQLRSLYQEIAESGKVYSTSPTAHSYASKIYSNMRDSVRNNFKGAVGKEISKMSDIYEIAPFIRRQAGGEWGPNLFGMQLRPVLGTKIIDRLGGAATAIPQIPQKLSGLGIPGQMGALSKVGQKAIPGIVGMSSQQPMEQDQSQLQQPVGQAEIPSDFDPIAIALQEQGFSVGQQQQPQQQFDMQKLQMDLVQAVSAGEMSTAQADWILGMMQQTYGGGEQDFASQLEQLAQVDKREASNLLARAVANGEINTTTANTLTRLYGLSAPAQTATAALDTADLIANETEQMLEELNLGDSEVGSAIGGTFRGLYGSAIGASKAGQYQEWIEGARTKIARALGEVGNLSEPEQIAAMKLMPTLKDTKESAANKLARFRRLIDGARRRMRGEYVPDMAPDIAVEAPSLNQDYDSWQN